MTCAHCGLAVSHLPASAPCPACQGQRKTFDPHQTLMMWPPPPSAPFVPPAAPLPEAGNGGKARRARWGVVGGILAACASFAVGRLHLPFEYWLGPFLFACAIVLFLWGLCCCAEAKGYSALLGLLGILGPVGLLILAILPDKNKKTA